MPDSGGGHRSSRQPVCSSCAMVGYRAGRAHPAAKGALSPIPPLPEGGSPDPARRSRAYRARLSWSCREGSPETAGAGAMERPPAIGTDPPAPDSPPQLILIGGPAPSGASTLRPGLAVAGQADFRRKFARLRGAGAAGALAVHFAQDARRGRRRKVVARVARGYRPVSRGLPLRSA